MATEQNSLGNRQTYGPYDGSGEIGYGVTSLGRKVVYEYVFDYDSLPKSSEDDRGLPRIPGNSFVVNAWVEVLEDVTIGSADTLEIDLVKLDGTAAGNLFTAYGPGNAGTWDVGGGAEVGAGITSDGDPVQVEVSGTSDDANFTAGKLRLVIETISSTLYPE